MLLHTNVANCPSMRHGRQVPKALVSAQTKERIMDYRRFFEEAIDQLHAEKRYRVFADLERIVGRFPELSGATMALPVKSPSGVPMIILAWDTTPT